MKFHVNAHAQLMLLTCVICTKAISVACLSQNSDWDSFFRANLWFGHFSGGIISCDGALERCYIVLYWVGWWSKKMIFALKII